MTERSGVITFQGNPLTLIGPALKVGSEAPHFVLTANDLSDLRCEAHHGKVLVLSVVPSLDTPVCAMQTRTFNQRATQLAKDVVVLTVSMDLPFAQKRFCEAEKLAHIRNLSTFRAPEFGKTYGVTITSGPLAGLLSRAVVVLNKENRVVYVEQVPEIAQEPNYAAALDAVRKA
jgi:thiol peroxidase